ncbi:MAG: radical SAM protein [Candidatus Woesearchaeota archaeon]|jgi:oxygen-independent coproporphyrinogen-3 oxidase
MKKRLNHYELIKERVLLDLIEQINNKKSMRDTETIYASPYYYGNSEDESVPLERLLERIKGADIQNLYVHVPFCKQECHYCTYPKIIAPDQEQVIDYLRELKREISRYKSLFSFSDLKTIHIGGGTPNFFDHQQLEDFLGMITREFPKEKLEELDIEVSPVGLDEEKLKLISKYGFNRISFGIQTFEDKINRTNGRVGQKAEEAKRLINIAKRYFPNVSIDLLAGQKGQTEASLERDFEQALRLDINSIFLYQIRQAFGKNGIEEIKALNRFLNYFSEKGYEILSQNHAIKKRNSDGYCEQREGRGRLENLLGLGPGAVSEVEGHVFKNLCPGRYLVEESKIEEGSIKLRKVRNLKAMFLVRSLRYFIRPEINGMLIQDYVDKWSSNPYDDFEEEIKFMRENNLIDVSPKKIEVTSKGILLTQWMDNYLTKHYK